MSRSLFRNGRRERSGRGSRRQPINFNAQVFYNAVKPDVAAVGNLEWRFQLSFLFPK